MSINESYGYSSQTQPSFKKTSVFFTIIMSIITIAIYMPYWFVSRQKDINKLDSKQKLPAWPAKVVMFLYILSALMIPLTITGDPAMNDLINTIDKPITYGGVATLLYLAFQTRRMMHEHLGEKKISGVLTFFFSIWYLQYKINEHFK